MAEEQDLFITVKLDDQASESLAKLRGDLQYFASGQAARGMEGLGRQTRETATQTKSLDTTIAALGARMGFVGGIVGGMTAELVRMGTEMVSRATDLQGFAKEMTDLQHAAQRMGQTTAQLREFQNAYRESGLSIEAATEELGNFSRKVADLQTLNSQTRQQILGSLHIDLQSALRYDAMMSRATTTAQKFNITVNEAHKIREYWTQRVSSEYAAARVEEFLAAMGIPSAEHIRAVRQPTVEQIKLLEERNEEIKKFNEQSAQAANAWKRVQESMSAIGISAWMQTGGAGAALKIAEYLAKGIEELERNAVRGPTDKTPAQLEEEAERKRQQLLEQQGMSPYIRGPMIRRRGGANAPQRFGDYGIQAEDENTAQVVRLTDELRTLADYLSDTAMVTQMGGLRAGLGGGIGYGGGGMGRLPGMGGGGGAPYGSDVGPGTGRGAGGTPAGPGGTSGPAPAGGIGDPAKPAGGVADPFKPEFGGGGAAGKPWAGTGISDPIKPYLGGGAAGKPWPTGIADPSKPGAVPDFGKTAAAPPAGGGGVGAGGTPLTAGPGGYVDKGTLNTRLGELIKGSGLEGLVPADAARYGIKTGSAGEWAALMTNLAGGESSFRATTHGDIGKFGGAGSRGLFQLSPQDAITYGIQNTPFTMEQLNDPEFNARAAVQIAAKRVRAGGIGGPEGMAKYWAGPGGRLARGDYGIKPSDVREPTARQAPQGPANPGVSNTNAQAIRDISGQVNLPIGGTMTPEGLLIHHTSGQEKGAEGVANVLRGRGLSVQYVIDRDGNITQLTPEGRQAFHAGRLEKSETVAGRRLGNFNLEGVEVIARNEGDVTPGQREAIARLTKMRSERWGWDPKTGVWGHGELTGRKESDEGRTARMIREGKIRLPASELKAGAVEGADLDAANRSVEVKGRAKVKVDVGATKKDEDDKKLYGETNNAKSPQNPPTPEENLEE